MTELADALVGLATQHRDDVSDAEALLDADHAGKDLLGDHGAVGKLLHIAEAEIARRAVRIGVLLAEVIDQRLVPAHRAARVAIDVVYMPQHVWHRHSRL